MHFTIYVTNELKYQRSGIGKQLGEPIVLYMETNQDHSLYNDVIILTHIVIHSFNPTWSVSPVKWS